VEDGNRFKHEIVERLKNYKHGTGHKPECKCPGDYKQRSGITITTSIVDNFLKIVKRKLKKEPVPYLGAGGV